ncbi:MAG: hypothetical protein P4N59_10795 [Negativicutes bacterium]|nr:hypothetical protein [Negativicutes bacterium]
MINGKRYAWEDITINFPHGVMIDIQNVEYSDKKDFEPIYGKGSNPQGYGAGNYSAEGKADLLKEEFNRLKDYAAGQAKSLYRLPPFPVTVSYADDEGNIKSDKLQSCLIKDVKHSAKQGDKSMVVPISFLILDGIEYDGFPANDS